MITFSDLLTLLLTMFVMRLSMSSLNGVDVATISKDLRVAPKSHLGQSEQTDIAQSIDSNNAQTFHASPLSQTLKEKLYALGSNETDSQIGPKKIHEIKIEEDELGTLISLGGSTFESSSDTLSFQAEQALVEISAALRNKPVDIRITGHTDNIPVNSKRFPSNWELSAARALAVVRQMIDAGVDPKAISAVGYSDTRPIASNQSSEGRHLNRRIEILISERPTVDAKSK